MKLAAEPSSCYHDGSDRNCGIFSRGSPTLVLDITDEGNGGEEERGDEESGEEVASMMSAMRDARNKGVLTRSLIFCSHESSCTQSTASPSDANETGSVSDMMLFLCNRKLG